METEAHTRTKAANQRVTLECQRLTSYHAKYFAWELAKRCASDDVQKFSSTLLDAQVDLNPHQIDAALFAFRSPLSKGAILADEVGLGKTIEAGILLSQKWAEGKRRLLVIVPANLRQQWHQELAEKFFLPATILETRSFNERIGNNGKSNPFSEKNKIVICSYQFARAKGPYIEAMSWDLVVIDEAHRLRNVYKPGSRIANAIKNAIATAPKVLLTATPLQNSLLELYGLVSIVDEFVFGDLKTFKAQFSQLLTPADVAELKLRLQPICQRTLRKQVLEYVPFTKRYALVQEFYPSDEERRLYNQVSGYLQRPELFALPAGQRTLMTLVLRKLLASSTYAIAGTLDALIFRLEQITEHKASPEIDVLATDLSSFPEMAEEWNSGCDQTPAEATATNGPWDSKRLCEELELLRQFRDLARSIPKNMKGEVLTTALKRGFDEAQLRGAAKKAVIFTESARTQAYLYEILEKTVHAGKIVLFNGSNNDEKSKNIYQSWLEKHAAGDRVTGSASADMRAALVEYFRDEGEILIATEAAAEGINLQFCSLVVNYDLPWNPQRIEQRIGRCHRYGQKCDVVVVNFLNKENAADQRVYELLDEKFKLFNGVFGSSDEILGSIESGVDFEKRIASIYQRCRTPAEIEADFRLLQVELDSQIDERVQETRSKLLEKLDDDVVRKLRLREAQNKTLLGKYENWLWLLTKFSLSTSTIFEEMEDGTKSFHLNSNPFPEEDIQCGSYRLGRKIEDTHRYHPTHPLARRIIEECKSLETVEATITFGYTASRRKNTGMAALKGKSGWLRLTCLSTDGASRQDHLVFTAIADDDEPVSEDQCRQMFLLPASEGEPIDENFNEDQKGRLAEIFLSQRKQILHDAAQRKEEVLQREKSKYRRWAKDQQNLTKESEHLRQVDEQIKLAEKEARQAQSLRDKLKWSHERRSLEKKREEVWKCRHRAAAKIEAQAEEFIGLNEAQLECEHTEQVLFTIRWKVV